MPYKKSTLKTVWREEPDILVRTCNHRFRNDLDVNQYIFRYWRLASGDFVPHEILGKYKNMGEDNSAIYDAIKNCSYKLLCINDKDNQVNFEIEKRKLIEAFEKVFPKKSQFEL